MARGSTCKAFGLPTIGAVLSGSVGTDAVAGRVIRPTSRAASQEVRSGGGRRERKIPNMTVCPPCRSKNVRDGGINRQVLPGERSRDSVLAPGRLRTVFSALEG